MEKEQREEIKELKGSIRYKNTYTKNHKQPARHLTPYLPYPIPYGLNSCVSHFQGLISKI